jgi:hypothetical protein
MWGVEVSFAEASQLAERFLLFRVSDNTVRKQTEGYGNAQAHVEQEWIEKAEDEKALQVRHRHLDPQPGRIYASIDGAQVPLQQEWRELKTLCWYQVEKILPSIPRKHHGQSTGERNDLQATAMKYHCDITAAEQFGRLLWATGLQNYADTYDEVVFVSDGAVRIWRLVEQYFPQATQIVDSYVKVHRNGVFHMDAQGVITVPPIFDQRDVREGLGGSCGHMAMIPPVPYYFPPRISL